MEQFRFLTKKCTVEIEIFSIFLRPLHKKGGKEPISQYLLTFNFWVLLLYLYICNVKTVENVLR